jgi:hypothetical protein
MFIIDSWWLQNLLLQIEILMDITFDELDLAEAKGQG